MSESDLKELKNELEKFDHAMMGTRRGDAELRSRPMRIAGVDDRCHIWFISSVSSGKLDEITEFPSANLSFQDGQRFISVSGIVRVTRDSDAIDEYWSASQAVWFEAGRNDPELVLIEIIPTYAEYWDRSGMKGLKFLLLEAQAMVSGDTLDADSATHEKVQFSDSRHAGNGAEQVSRR